MKQYESDLDVLLEALNVNGKNVVDVGCGDGTKAKQLVEQGAIVIGVEPNLKSWQVNELESPSFKILSGGAEKLDIRDGWADVVIFMYSLHHVPTELMGNAISEARRVLKDSGTLYIAEPIAQGSYQDVCEPFLDETSIREQARQAVQRAAKAQSSHCHEFEYQVSDYFDSFSAFVDEMMRYSLDRYELNDIDNRYVKERFDSTKIGGSYRLDQPVKVWVLSNSNLQ